ncbi:type II toxin-antitoxin system HicB family antitoxin [candidate division KSB1 bacterium]|nr:type II toxin-antitoxin system HicB family antitoxin [candidate division KSB1 bacterium]MBL7095961.1 type II toxin-antitoxin system HicB family antitoxin [candidate division KSB1 bacterium]
MKYTVILTEDKKGNFYANVPSIPECNARAKCRADVIDDIRHKIANVIKNIEIIQLDVPVSPKSGNLQNEIPWKFFGAFKDSPHWESLFDEIEKQRELN